jgi:hypothetical protein
MLGIFFFLKTMQFYAEHMSKGNSINQGDAKGIVIRGQLRLNLSLKGSEQKRPSGDQPPASISAAWELTTLRA